MVKNRVMLTGLLFAGLVNTQAQAGTPDSVTDWRKLTAAAAVTVAGANVVRYYLTPKAERLDGCPLAGRSQTSKVAGLRLGHLTVGLSDKTKYPAVAYSSWKALLSDTGAAVCVVAALRTGYYPKFSLPLGSLNPFASRK